MIDHRKANNNRKKSIERIERGREKREGEYVCIKEWEKMGKVSIDCLKKHEHHGKYSKNNINLVQK